MHKAGQLNLLFDLLVPHLQLFISISDTAGWVFASQPLTCTASAAACRAWLWAGLCKEPLSPAAAALGKLFLLSTQRSVEQQGSSGRLGAVGGETVRPYTSPERTGRGKM